MGYLSCLVDTLSPSVHRDDWLSLMNSQETLVGRPIFPASAIFILWLDALKILAALWNVVRLPERIARHSSSVDNASESLQEIFCYHPVKKFYMGCTSVFWDENADVSFGSNWLGLVAF